MRKILFLVFFLTINVFHALAGVNISGYIMDSSTGEILIGAIVTDGTSYSTTNSYGFFTLPVKNNTVDLSFSNIGFQTVNVHLSAYADTSLHVHLVPLEHLSEAVVSGKGTSGINSSYVGSMDIPIDIMKTSPTLFGEPDLLKVLQKTPGVQTGMEGMAGIFVRGGGVEENMQLYDGVPLYNVNHLFGLLSLFHPEAIKNISFYKGTFPAKYGGRISSVIDVRTNDGNTERFTGSASLGLLLDRVHFEGPMFGGKMTYSLSFRSMPSYFCEKQMASLVDFGYGFYDANVKVVYRLPSSDKLYLSLYSGNDKFVHYSSEVNRYSYDSSVVNDISVATTNNTLNYDWGNHMLSFRWNHVFSSRLFADFCVYSNKYNSLRNNEHELSIVNEMHELYNEEFFLNTSVSGISDFNMDMLFELSADYDNNISFGAQVTRHNYTPMASQLSTKRKESLDGSEELVSESGIASNMNGIESSVFVEDFTELTKGLYVNTGLRVAMFETQKKYYCSVEPRVSVKYSVNDAFSAKAGYSEMSQYVHLLTTGMMSLPTDLWIPITKDIEPVKSEIVSAGLYYSTEQHINFSLEGYWKRSHDVLDYKDGKASLTSFSDWTETVSAGEGLSKGIEFMVEKKVGRTTGWLSYTLSKSDRWYPDGSVNRGKPFPYTYDRRHNLNISISNQITSLIDFHASWTWYSGNMITLPNRVGMIYGFYGNLDVPYVEERNDFRLPPTHHLDISTNFNKAKINGERTWSVGIYNIYGRKNPNVIEQYVDRYDMVANKVSFLIFIPFVSYSFDF